MNKAIQNIEQDPDTGTIAICAIRYCIGRRTYMPLLVIDWTKRHWESLSPSTHKVIYQDLKEAFYSGRDLGDTCDLDNWLAFWEWVQRKLLFSDGSA